MKFIWIWKYYTFRGEQVLVTATRQAESCVDRAFRQAMNPNDPPLPDIVTYQRPDGQRLEVSKPDFINEAEPLDLDLVRRRV